MPKRKTQKNKNKRVGKKQRRRTAVRQHGGNGFTLSIKSVYGREKKINVDNEAEIKNMIDNQIKVLERNNYVFIKRSPTEYAVTPISLFEINMDSTGTTVSTWEDLMKNNVYFDTTYAEDFISKNLLPYDLFMKTYFP